MEKEPVRVAHIIGKWVGGGVEAVVMNYYRHIDHSKIQFDFICDNDSTNIPYEEIESLGGKVILIPPYQKIFKYQKELIKVLKNGNYKIVHSHINALSVFPLRAAKKAGIPIRIAHSHSTTNKKELKKNLIKIILRPFSKLYATDYFACTEHAGRWLFGNRLFYKGKVFLINNAIDLSKFEFSESIRNKKRTELDIDKNTLVMGNIGRFVKQKNHDFLIDIFNEVHKQNKNSILVLIGQGPLYDNIKIKVEKLGLNDSVKFLGQRNDVNELYSIFDIFLLPSLYEGLGMVLIEAQCSGCNCIASTEVPKIAKVTDKLYFLDLDSDASAWAEIVLNKFKNSNRKISLSEIADRGYDIKQESKKLEKKYLEIQKGVELFGLPGCGKSSYAMECITEFVNLNERYVYSTNRYIRNIKKLVLIMSELFCCFKKYISSILLLKQIDFSSYVKKIKMMIYFLSTISLIKKGQRLKRKGNKVILEEGLLQVLWGICYNSNANYEFIDKFINLFNEELQDEIVIFNVDVKIILGRLKERNNDGGSELEHDIKNNENAIFRAEKIKEDIIECLKDNIKNKQITEVN